MATRNTTRAICLRLVPLMFLIGFCTQVQGQQPGIEDAISVTIVGTLRTGLVAIGGETTGTTITAKGITWELDFGNNLALRNASEKFAGRQVTVRGSLERRKGVEVKERWVVTVADLRLASDLGTNEDQQARFDVTLGRDNTQLEIRLEQKETVFDIRSPVGIDTATIKRAAAEWPSSMLVRLHLQGLESFQARHGDVTVQWSVASSGAHSSRVSLRSGSVETALSKESPYFTAVRIVGGNGKVPLHEGHFEVRLPAKLFEGNPQEISLRWIDFYRN